jgi:putative nucleotidyltransferase with HDIG domain
MQGSRVGLVALLAGLLVGDAALGAQVFSFAVDVDVVWATAVLCALGALGERASARLTSSLEVSISTLVIVIAAVALGPAPAALVGAASMLTDRAPIMKWAIYTAGRALTGVVTGLAVAAVPEVPQSVFLYFAMTAAVGAATAELLDTLLAGVTSWLRGASNAQFLASLAPVMLISVPLSATIAAPLGYAYSEISQWTLLLFLPPAAVAQRLFVLYQEQRKLAEHLGHVNRRLEKAHLSFARSLVAALDARDRYTAGHSAAVAIYARDIARELGMSIERQATAHLAGLLHDIGKVGLPPGILEKAGPLTPEERSEMEQHSAIGERILRNVEDYDEIAGLIRHHHERVDGKGYPDGVSGTAIPLLSRVLAVADSYNAMTSGRPYRAALTPKEARRRLMEGCRSQFDPNVVAAFDAVLEQADDLYLRGATADFALELQAHSADAEVSTEVAEAA